MTQYGFFFDQSRCYNCHACVVACRDWNDIPPGPVKWLKILQWEEGIFPNVRMNAVFATCYHCENPVCIDACPNSALFKEDKYGAVLVDEDKCQGARQCWIACPYGVLSYEDDAPGTPVTKCNMCIDRLENGEMPICVASCPGRALDFGPLEELKEKYGEIQELEGMPRAQLAQPAIVFKPKRKRENLLPYDAEKALKLLQQRPDLPPIFEDEKLIKEFPAEIVGYNKLIMKPESVEKGLALSKNEEG